MWYDHVSHLTSHLLTVKVNKLTDSIKKIKFIEYLIDYKNLRVSRDT